MDLDPFSLSRQVERSLKRYRNFRRELRETSEFGDPFSGSELFGRTTYQEIETFKDTDPLKRPLLRWVHRLTERRIHVPWIAKDAELELRDQQRVRVGEDSLLTLEGLRRSAWFGAEGERDVFLQAWFSASGALSAHRAEMFSRIPEIARRLGLPDDGGVFSPLLTSGETEADAGVALALEPSVLEPSSLEQSSLEQSSLEQLAREVLEGSRAVAEELIPKGYLPFVDALCFSGAFEGWPARLSPDVLRSLLGSRELFLGLSLELGPLPSRLCPASFVRAGTLLGRELCFAARPLDLPFVAARDPDDLFGHETGALFGLWMLSPAFQTRALGLSVAQVRERRRVLSAGVAAALRLEAARCLLFFSALRGRSALYAAFSELSLALTGQELPPSAALVAFRVRCSEPARFAGLLSSGARYQALRDAHDEDWFRNPRAEDELRTSLARPDTFSRPLKDCQNGLAHFRALWSDF